MRAKVVKGFGSGPVWLCQDDSSEQGLRIDQKDGAPIVPVLPEFVGQHFCLIDWEEERVFRGGPGAFGAGFPQRNVLRNIIWGRLTSESWPDVPRVGWCLATDMSLPERVDISQDAELASVLQSCSFSYPDKNVLCLGDEECLQIVKETLGYSPQIPVYIEPHVWADIFLAMPDQSFPIPDLVQKELVDRLKKTALECSSLKGKSARLAAEKAATDAQIRELEERMAELALRGAT
jgi:hypothetical protein